MLLWPCFRRRRRRRREDVKSIEYGQIFKYHPSEYITRFPISPITYSPQCRIERCPPPAVAYGSSPPP